MLNLHRSIACSAASSVNVKQAAEPSMPAERELPGGVKEGKLFRPFSCVAPAKSKVFRTTCRDIQCGTCRLLDVERLQDTIPKMW